MRNLLTKRRRAYSQMQSAAPSQCFPASNIQPFNQHRVSQRLHQKSNLVTRSEPIFTLDLIQSAPRCGRRLFEAEREAPICTRRSREIGHKISFILQTISSSLRRRFLRAPQLKFLVIFPHLLLGCRQHSLLTHPGLNPFEANMGAETVHGKWDELFTLGNCAIHLHLLPNGKVLYWGRRSTENVKSEQYWTLNEHKTHVYILDPDTLKIQRTKTNPVNEDGLSVNLFCAGHTFQPDGTLLIFGGHVLDGFGEDQACVYDYKQEKFTPMPMMAAGRWYPSAITLSDGRGLVVSGSSQDVVNPVINLVPQIWDAHKGEWGIVQTPEVNIFSLYPRLYHVPDGRIFMAGPLQTTRFLDLNAHGGHGEWSDNDHSPCRKAGQREYAASAMYDSGKIIYVSGGGGDDDFPTKMVEIIDLNVPKNETPKWQCTSDITHGRRHSFATTLPDGTVLVTGGTQGKGFNDLTKAVHEPELWDPVTGEWSTMTGEREDRGYHHTALLLPDGRVLSAGGGEWDPDNQKRPNDPVYTKITAQIFSPPYLFKGKRPTVSTPPEVIEYGIDYGQKFTVTVDEHDEIGKVSWTRLGSVTHSHNMNQSFQFLNFTTSGTEVTIEAPKDHKMAPPGHYMLFLVSKEGVPAMAPILLLKMDTPIDLGPQQPPAPLTRAAALENNIGVTVEFRNEKVLSEQKGRPPVLVGLTPTCPYGLGACWGGAYEALNYIEDIKTVLPKPNSDISVAFVYLHEDKLPNINIWREQLHKVDGGTYKMRGIEMTLTGVVTEKGHQLTLSGTSTRPEVVLNQFKADSKLDWDNVAKVPKPLTNAEAGAYSRLYQKVVSHSVSHPKEELKLQVTGRLQMDENKKYSLDVKAFKEPEEPSKSG
jgi:galactose oxidase